MIPEFAKTSSHLDFILNPDVLFTIQAGGIHTKPAPQLELKFSISMTFHKRDPITGQYMP